MVSGGFTREREKARYRRRKPIPAIVIVVLLLVTAVVVWTKVIAKSSDVDAAVACAQPTVSVGQKKPATGTVLPYDALDKITPAPPGEVKVQVYNASKQRGAATQASTQLAQDGFQVGAPANDPLYVNQQMKCRGQIRFGANGESEARTVSLIVPCTQLVRDGRQDAGVDLAIGSDFTSVAPNTQAQQAIQQLTAWAAKHPAPQGGQQAQNGVVPQLNANLLAQAHSNQC